MEIAGEIKWKSQDVVRAHEIICNIVNSQLLGNSEVIQAVLSHSVVINPVCSCTFCDKIGEQTENQSLGEGCSRLSDTYQIYSSEL